MTSHSKLRTDKNCLNCGHEVEQRFCGFCGQENTEPKQRFIDLVYHFFEDLTHYEGKFWKTMRLLLFKPGHLTKIYLEGKRASFVPPVRLYIFISFLAFFIPFLIPADSFSEQEKEKILKQNYSPPSQSIDFSFTIDEGFYIDLPFNIESQAECDSLIREHAVDDPLNTFLIQKSYDLRFFNPLEIGEKFKKSIAGSIPKALFVYMPLFALVTGLFHSRKKWYYFDHGIFTLHFFAFALLVFSLFTLSQPLHSVIPSWLPVDLQAITVLFFLPILIFYFIIAHYRIYSNSIGVSLIKSLFILGINLFLLLVVFIIVLILSLYFLN
jgi:hypothetical protein